MQTSAVIAPSRPNQFFFTLAVFLLFFVSGVAGLIYEVLWFRAAGILFGNTAQAAATVLAAFFAGLFAGSVFWGGRAAKIKSPVLGYAVLQAGLGLSAALYFFLKPAYFNLYLRFFPALGSSGVLLTAFQFILSAGFIFLPSFFMGGTFPFLLDWSVRNGFQAGRAGTLLYAVNTAGAALGALAAGYFLPPALGFQNSYVLVLALTFLVTAVSFGMAGFTREVEPSISSSLIGEEVFNLLPSQGRKENWVWHFAFASGFLTLGLEVLWTHMFAQVLHNSVYTFSAVLVIFLLALSVGSFLAHVLCWLNLDSRSVLFSIFLASGAWVGSTPFLFNFLTGGLSDLWSSGAWSSYLVSVFRLAVLTLWIPVVAIGTVFPFLLRGLGTDCAEGSCTSDVGRFSGRLLAWNALGSVTGSLAAGFVMLRWLGLWPSIRLVAAFYFLLALFSIRRSLRPVFALLPLVGITLLFTAFDSSHLPLLHLDKEKGEKLLQFWEGRYGTVAVIQDREELKLKMNNFFGLGGTGTRRSRMAMADLPILLHPDAKSVFFLGMGTGITAGRSLDHPSVTRVVVSELVPEVAQAARAYFSEKHDLFNDPRVHLFVGDGRNYLLAHPEAYDIVIGDLFFPWEAGAGSLYTKEHFEVVLKRLRPGGVFAQWLPLYQMTEREFLIIANTMRKIFPLLTLWRGDFLVGRPIAALIGYKEAAPLDPEGFLARFFAFSEHADIPESVRASIPFAHYGGNLSAARRLFADARVNTDDLPLIEYLAPKSFVEVKAGRRFWLTSVELAQFLEELSRQVPFEGDPFLGKLTPGQLSNVRAGLELYVYEVAGENGYPKIADVYWQRICNRLGPERCGDFRTALEHKKKD